MDLGFVTGAFYEFIRIVWGENNKVAFGSRVSFGKYIICSAVPALGSWDLGQCCIF
jgi:hypothetical protein